MVEKVSLLGSSYEISDKKLLSEMMLYTNAFQGLEVIYCGTKSGFLHQFTSALVRNNNVSLTGYLCNEYMDDVSDNLTQKVIYASIIDRRSALINNPDAVIIFPGGFGTTAELYDVLDQLQHNKLSAEVILVNPLGYWDHALRHIETIVKLNMSEKISFISVTAPDELSSVLCQGTNC